MRAILIGGYILVLTSTLENLRGAPTESGAIDVATLGDLRDNLGVQIGKGSEQKSIEPSSTSEVFSSSNLGLTRWDWPEVPFAPIEEPSRQFYCVGLSDFTSPNTLIPERSEVRFYEKIHDEFFLRYVYSCQYDFAAFGWFSGGCLLVKFKSTSAANFYVAFGIEDGSICPVWENVSTEYPEIADVDNDGIKEVISTGRDHFIWTSSGPAHVPSERWIYKWVNGKFILAKKWPWRSGLRKENLSATKSISN